MLFWLQLTVGIVGSGVKYSAARSLYSALIPLGAPGGARSPFGARYSLYIQPRTGKKWHYPHLNGLTPRRFYGIWIGGALHRGSAKPNKIIVCVSYIPTDDASAQSGRGGGGLASLPDLTFIPAGTSLPVSSVCALGWHRNWADSRDDCVYFF